MHGDGLPIEQAFRDGNGQPADGLEAVFPIIQRNDREAWQPIGTGFFISNNGLFATAKHVLVDDRTGDIQDSLAGVQLIRREGRVIIRDIIKVTVHPTADVAIGFLFDKQFSEQGQQSVNKCFALSRSDPTIGELVATFAFPNSGVTETESNFQVLFTSSWLRGTVDNVLPDGRDRVLLPSKCFQTTLNILGGASGGPVAFGDGVFGGVFGINSTGLQGHEDISFISSIHDLFDLAVPNVCMPDGTIRDQVTIRELGSLGLVMVRD